MREGKQRKVPGPGVGRCQGIITPVRTTLLKTSCGTIRKPLNLKKSFNNQPAPLTQLPCNMMSTIAAEVFAKKNMVDDEKKCKHAADRKMAKSHDVIPWKQRQWGHMIARNAINTKQKIGLGTRKTISEDLVTMWWGIARTNCNFHFSLSEFEPFLSTPHFLCDKGFPELLICVKQLSPTVSPFSYTFCFDGHDISELVQETSSKRVSINCLLRPLECPTLNTWLAPK